MIINWGLAILGGILGTAGMTILGAWVAPMMGMQPMNPADMLSKAMNNRFLGWIGHFMIGIILAIIYAFVEPYFPGPDYVRGAIYSLIPWFLAMVIVIPMMGMSLFMGSMMKTVQSLIGHVVYGLILGAVYGMSYMQSGVHAI